MSKCVNAYSAYTSHWANVLSVHASVSEGKVSVVTTNPHSSARSLSDAASFLLPFPSLSFALLLHILWFFSSFHQSRAEFGGGFHRRLQGGASSQRGGWTERWSGGIWPGGGEETRGTGSQCAVNHNDPITGRFLISTMLGPYLIYRRDNPAETGSRTAHSALEEGEVGASEGVIWRE